VIAVLHVITRLTLGGSSENTIAQVVSLTRAGYDCSLAVGLAESETDSVADARRRGCAIVDVPALGRELAPFRDVAVLRHLWRLLRARRPAIVHTHSSKAGFIGRLAARLAGVPIVIHQPHGHIFYGYFGAARTGLYLGLERLAARWCDRIIALTDHGIDEHLLRGVGRRAQYVAVPSGVPTAEIRARAPGRAAARARLGVGPDDLVILGVGRLVAIKGFDLLVDALARVRAELPAAHVVLVGDGPQRHRLAARAAEIGVADRVRFVGPSRDVPAYLAAADVLVAPSRNEGMGRVLVEAMALGVPVIGAAAGGIPSVVGRDESGRVIPVDDVGALAGALAELGRDAALRAKLGEAGRARAEQFSLAEAERRLLDLYAGLVRDAGLARAGGRRRDAEPA
jgi:glycosyltransferase involved in cell wall biosynthesis